MKLVKSSDYITFNFSRTVGAVLPAFIQFTSDQIELVSLRKFVGCTFDTYFIDAAGQYLYPNVAELEIFIASPDSLLINITGGFVGGVVTADINQERIFVRGNQGFQSVPNIEVKRFGFETWCSDTAWLNGTLFLKVNFIFRAPEKESLRFAGQKR